MLVLQRLDVKLTDLQKKIDLGQKPLPLMTCVNVKSDRTARSFQGKHGVNVQSDSKLLECFLR